MLSLNKDVCHRPVRTDFLREVAYHNNLIAVSRQKYLENAILTNNVIQASQLEQEEKGKQKVSKTAVPYEKVLDFFFPHLF